MRDACGWLVGLFRRRAYSLVVVRRYADANGSYVGELYLLGTFLGTLQYSMIGVSLDTLPLDCALVNANGSIFTLDTLHDFLAPMPMNTVRVGAQDPRDNDAVRRSVAGLARKGRISLQVSNRFVEHVMEKKA